MADPAHNNTRHDTHQSNPNQAQQSRQSPGPKAKAGAAAVTSVSDRMQATFGVHLEEVKKLLDALRKRIFENVADCFRIVQVGASWGVLMYRYVEPRSTTKN